MDEEPKEFFEKFKGDLKRIREVSSGTGEDYTGFFESVMEEGYLSTLQKQLIALGIAVALQSERSIKMHIQKCLDAGASRQEILESSAVAAMIVGAGAYACVSSVMDILDELTAKQ